MKKTIFSLLVLCFITLSYSNTYAQKYFVYDGDEFSVMLTADNANTKITRVQFSFENKWVDFKITNFENLESTNEGGFLYTVKDGQGRDYTVDYYRTQDFIYVTNAETGDKWTLNRRDE